MTRRIDHYGILNCLCYQKVPKEGISAWCNRCAQWSVVIIRDGKINERLVPKSRIKRPT